MNNNSSKKRVESQQFLQSKNEQLDGLLYNIECPEQQNIPRVQPTKKVQDSLDSLTLLLSRAKKATEGNERYRVQHKSKKISQDQAFLTGVEIQVQKIKHKQDDELKREILDEEVKKLLSKKTLQDELDLLKRQIKQTDGFLRSYSKQVLRTQKSVGKLAGRYACHLNLRVPGNGSSMYFSGYSAILRSHKQFKIDR